MGNRLMVDTLIKNNAKINKVDNNDEIPLFIAIRSSNVEIIDTLLRGFQPNTTNRKRQTALHLACMSGSTEIARKLIECGLDVNERDIKGNTPMHYATMCDCVEVVNILLNHRADPTIRNAKGKSPFFYASVEVAKIFRQYFQGGGALDSLYTSTKRQSQINSSTTSPIGKITLKKGRKNQPLTPQKRYSMQTESFSEISSPMKKSIDESSLDRNKSTDSKKLRSSSQIQNNQSEYISRDDFVKYQSEIRHKLDDLIKRMNQLMVYIQKEKVDS